MIDSNGHRIELDLTPINHNIIGRAAPMTYGEIPTPPELQRDLGGPQAAPKPKGPRPKKRKIACAQYPGKTFTIEEIAEIAKVSPASVPQYCSPSAARRGIEYCGPHRLRIRWVNA